MIKMSSEDKENINFLIESVKLRLEEILRNFNLYEHLKEDYYKSYKYSEISYDLKEILNDLYKYKKGLEE